MSSSSATRAALAMSRVSMKFARPSPAAPVHEPADTLPPARLTRMSAKAEGRRTVDATGWRDKCASICMCHASGFKRVAGPIAESFTMWRTPAATAPSIKAISLATCWGDVPCAMKSRSDPRSASSSVFGRSKSIAAMATSAGKPAASARRLNATTSTGSEARRTRQRRADATGGARHGDARLAWNGLIFLGHGGIKSCILELSVQH